MREPDYRPEIKLNGINGNAFAILGGVTKALRKANADKEYIARYLDQATAGDYNHLLGVTMEYVDVC